jgi:DNA-binding NarL/FixJ family response regulator
MELLTIGQVLRPPNGNLSPFGVHNSNVGKGDPFSANQWAELKRDLALSPRQAQVVEQLLLGHSDKRIASELQMSVATVRTHLGRLFSRLDVADRCGLIAHVYARFLERCGSCGCPRVQ